MAEIVPSLVHLEPPNLSPMMVARFSPYQARPEEHGLRLTGPLRYYGLLYDVDDARLCDLAQAFEFAHDDGRDPDAYVAELRARVALWNRDWPRNRGALTYRRGAGFLEIVDTRTTTAEPARFMLEDEEAAAYLACDAGASVDAVARAMRSASNADVTETRAREALEQFKAARLVYEERGRYLSLAVPRRAR